MKLKLFASFLAVAALLAALAIVETRARARSAAAMADAATKFLAALTPEQRAKASFRFDDEQRLDWHFVPRDRKGLPVKEMNEAQRKAATDFLKTGLSQRGYLKASTIMTLENVLQVIEGPNRKWPRDPELYYFSVFGTPGAKEAWGWRVEGHHVALNFTLNKGSMVATSPAFFGSNPGEVRVEGPKKGLRVLAAEEDLARELVKSLDEKQRAKAVFDAKAPGDIISFNKVRAEPLDKAGITGSELNKGQYEQLTKLVEEYCNNVAEDLAAARREKFRGAKREQIYFAWAGGIERNDPHYYRVQTPTFLIEYDNTQNNANHIHSVWRDFNGDFGRDLLAEHYQSTPHGTQMSADVYTLDQVDVKPKVLRRMPAKYTDEARAHHVSGIVILNLMVTRDGSVEKVKVIQGLPDGLDDSAVWAARNTRFSPAIKDGKPVNVQMTIEMSFNVF
ncbi:MAG TPA: TonB family protein [Blastocatellia bacterium]|nr:TonB family protein [Blastocatellia bacterium]